MSAIEPLPARSTSKTVVIAALALVVTFLAGFITGAAVDRFVIFHRGGLRTPPPMVTDMMLHRLDRRLDLTDAQRDQIEKILERRHERIHNLTASTRPQIHAEIEQANAEIEKVLTPAQREKFQELKMRLGMRERHGGKGRKESTR